MSTTAIVAEILIVGLETLAWISLLVLALFGAGWLDLGALNEWEALVTLVVLATAYVVGIVADRGADTAQAWARKVRDGRPVDKPAGITRMRTTVLTQGGDAAAFMDYQRSRMRIARATAPNLALAVPASALFLGVRTDAGAGAIVGVAAVLLAGAVVAQLAYRRIEHAYIKRLADAYRVIRGLDRPELAAAVPVRRADGGPEFLLVRTKGKTERYTFPKGHPEKDETLAEAAIREAEEEAGVEGELDSTVLATYAYPAGSRPGRSKDYLVAAFLLDATAGSFRPERAEGGRNPAWVSYEEAVELARRNRDGQHAREMEKVLSAAAVAVER